MEADGWARGERAGAAAFSAAVLGAVLWPLTQYRRPLRERVDGFPLSWYPMFSARRPRKAGVNYAVGVRADGTRRYCRPRRWARPGSTRCAASSTGSSARAGSRPTW